MGDYYDIYKLRLNRFGDNYQNRLQGMREKNFSNYLLKSIYRSDFIYLDNKYSGSLEPYKQDKTQTLNYLLTETSLNMPNGIILQITDYDNQINNWMIFYKEQINSSGYNKYIVLKMTHNIEWYNNENINEKYNSMGYFCGKMTTQIIDLIESNANSIIYLEDSNYSFIIMPINYNIYKDSYILLINSDKKQQQFLVMGYDIQSTKGIMYITVKPIYEYNLSPNDDADDNNFWITGDLNEESN